MDFSGDKTYDMPYAGSNFIKDLRKNIDIADETAWNIADRGKCQYKNTSLYSI